MTTTPMVPVNAFPSSGRWTPEQTKLAFELYCQIPFGKIDSRNKRVIELATLLGRTPSAVAMKCLNIASIDPLVAASGRAGLGNASSLDQETWDEFHADWDRLTNECERLRQHLLLTNGESVALPQDVNDGFVLTDFNGETREAIVQQRVKQGFFRRAVLSSYRDRCCISGVSDKRLLVASHIVPWSADKANRLNPSNGLCLSAIHDKAFDCHLFTLSNDWRVILSGRIKASEDTFLREVFWPIDGKQIEMPERFAPDPTFIAKHRCTMLDSYPAD